MFPVPEVLQWIMLMTMPVGAVSLFCTWLFAKFGRKQYAKVDTDNDN